MVSLYCRKNLLKKWTLIFSIVMMLFPFYLISLNLLLSIKKTKVFYFSRLHSIFDPSPLDLNILRAPILYPKDTWYYLKFIFNRKLLFWWYIKFDLNKAFLTIKYMKILSNFMCELFSYQKCLLYRTCVLPIALYGFSL